MSRTRLTYALAFLGILITTGGCAESATAPEAASAAVSQNRSSNPTSRDSVATPSSSDDDGTVTVQGGFISGGS